MFKFIENKIKFHKIEKRQFSQHVIFMAQTAGEYFLFSEEERWKHLPPKTENFKVNFEVTEDSKILKIMNCKADDLTSISEALKIELKDIASKAQKISANKRRSRKMDRVIFINRLRKLFKKD